MKSGFNLFISIVASSLFLNFKGWKIGISKFESIQNCLIWGGVKTCFLPTGLSGWVNNPTI